MKPNKKVALFDIDYTLFDLDTFRKKLYGNISKALKQDRKKIERIGRRIYGEIRKKYGYFNPNEFVRDLKNNLEIDIDQNVLEQSIWDERSFRTSIYKETVDVLSSLEKKMIVGIFSKGHDRFQRAKLKTISQFLQNKHVYIVVDKYRSLPELIKKYKKHKLYLVDDELDVLHSASKLRKDVFTIWVKRGRYAVVQKPISGFAPDATVANLREVVKIINS